MKTFGGMTTEMHQNHTRNPIQNPSQNQQYSLRKTWIWENEKSARETIINLVVYEDFWRHDNENASNTHKKL